MLQEVNIIVKNPNLEMGDEDLFFGPLEPEDTFTIVNHSDLLQILVDHQFFKSKSDARKNGWSDMREIPLGFSQFVIGKKRRILTIFNPF